MASILHRVMHRLRCERPVPQAKDGMTSGAMRKERRMGLPYQNRSEAGQILAARLTTYAGRQDVLVLALPRGGVPVAFEVASALRTPLDVFLVRKLGVPGQEELAMGAIASGGIRVLNADVLRTLRIPPDAVEAVAAREQRELARREHLYRDGRAAPDVSGRTVILVDDGLATGSSMRAAVAALRQERPAALVVAVPVASPDTCAALGREVDEIICVETPEPFYGVGVWYMDFAQTTDAEVYDLLARAAREHPVLTFPTDIPDSPAI
jgi:predicted phosphoribosyltransferase